MEILLKSLLEGDGNINGKGFKYTTKSKQLADDFQELALKCGYSAIIGNDGYYRISLTKTNTS